MTDIGSAKWWASVPYANPIKKRQGNRLLLTCPKGFGGPSIVGVTVTTTTASGTTSTTKVDPRKWSTVAWVDGSAKRVRQGSQLCQKSMSPLRPTSRQELASWTFAPQAKLSRVVGIAAPPLSTCVAPVAPTVTSGRILGNDLVSAGHPVRYEDALGVATSSSDGPAGLTGIWDVEWILTGGQGLLRYPTMVKDAKGIYRWQQRQVVLDPAGTTVRVQAMLKQDAYGPAMQRHAESASNVAPDCGEQYLPSWLNDWYTGTGTQGIMFEVAPEISGTLTKPELERSPGPVDR